MILVVRRHHAPRSKHHASQRPGLTLLEVIVALTIFLTSLAVLTQLQVASGNRAMTAKLRSEAGLMCQSKLAEVIAGAVPMQSAGYAAFAEDAGWQWRIDCDEGDVSGLYNVQVWVKRDRTDGPVIEVTLSQMVLSPTKRGSSLDQPGPAGAASDNSGGSLVDQAAAAAGTAGGAAAAPKTPTPAPKTPATGSKGAKK